MDNLSALIINLIKVDSIWSIVIRGIIWVMFVSIFAIGVSQGKKYSDIKAEAGFFVAFLLLTATTIYLVYGIVPTITTTTSP